MPSCEPQCAGLEQVGKEDVTVQIDVNVLSRENSGFGMIHHGHWKGGARRSVRDGPVNDDGSRPIRPGRFRSTMWTD
jgi:hypothetical protein